MVEKSITGVVRGDKEVEIKTTKIPQVVRSVSFADPISKQIGSPKLPGTFERTGDRPSGVVGGGGSRPFQGPTRPGTDVEVFRATGVSQPIGGISEGTPEQIGEIKPGDPREVEAEERLQQESQRLGRDLFLSERDVILGGIFGGAAAEISEREKSIQARKEAFGSLGVLTPGESKRALFGFFQQKSLFEERPFITQRQVDIFEPRPGEQIPVFETVFVDPETGFVGKPTPEEERLLQGSQLTVEPALEPGRIESLRRRAETESLAREFTLTGQAGGFVAGAGASIVGTGQFIKSVVTEPIETTKLTAKSFQVLGRRAVTREGIPEVGQLLFEQGAFTAGFIGAEIAILKAPKLVTKGVDIFRTRGLKQLKAEQIIAPEFFRGQTFPSIRKGQTAGELLEEFKPLLPGEIKPAGFTAAPRPIKGVTIGRGTSEVPGLFQAPKVSPRFLRVGGEETKLVSLDFFGQTFRPSLFRVTPQEFKLVPGLKPAARVIQPQKIKGVKQFFETAPKGKSFVPFIKTEKEAIIPFETVLKPTAKRFFIKFEGRRIPIFKFETLPGAVKTTTKLPRALDIARSLSSSRVGRTGAISPFEILVSSSAIRSSLDPSRVLPSRRGLPSDVSSIRVPPSRRRIISRPSRVRKGVSIISPISRPSRILTPPEGVTPLVFDVIEPPKQQKKIPFFLGSPQLGKLKTKTPLPKRIFQRTPSLGAVLKSEFGIKQPKLSTGLERTGLVERAFIAPKIIKPLGPFKV